MYKAVIFDFDGTIADTMTQNYKAWKYALGLYNFFLDEDKYYYEEGKTPRAIIADFTHDKKIIEDILSAKEDYFIKNYELKIYDGVFELLERLNSSKKLALVTGGAKIRIEHILEKSNLKKYFDVIITANDVDKGKPNKEPYEKALKLLNFNPLECIVIENAPLGIESARNANIFCIALQTTLPKEKLKQANLVLNNFNELLKNDILN